MNSSDTPTRLKLAEWVDDYVFYGGRILEWEERSTGVWILLKNVDIAKHEPHLSGEEIDRTAIRVDHLWVIQSKEMLENDERDGYCKLERLKYVYLRGRPYQYRRLDGSIDYAISSVGSLDTDHLLDVWQEAQRESGYELMIAVSELIIEAWEVKKCPVTTRTQSTNDMVALHKETIRRCNKCIKRRDKVLLHRAGKQRARTRQGLAKGFG